MKHFWNLFCITGALILIGSYGSGQNITGSMSGRVTDGTGSVIVNATVTVTETAQNVATSPKTSADGNFTVAGLMPGNYSITVSSPGFKKLTRPGVQLDANDKLAIGDLVLDVGSVTDSVEVSAQTAVLQTENVERSATISGKQIENIETNGRNPRDIASMGPAVSFTNTTNYATGGRTGTNPS